MSFMFCSATSFHQDLRKWNVSQVKHVKNYGNIFTNAESFDIFNSPHFTTLKIDFFNF